MLHLILTAACFFGFILTHILVARLKKGALNLTLLIPIFLLWAGALGLLLRLFSRSVSMPVSAMILFACLALFYVNEIMVLRDKSPSLELLRLLGSRFKDGASFEQLTAHFRDEVWIVPRLEYLVEQGRARKAGGRYHIQPGPGRFLILVVTSYRALIRRGMGG